MGTHSRVLSESYPINTNMTGFRQFSEIFLVLWTKLAPALEGFTISKLPQPLCCGQYSSEGYGVLRSKVRLVCGSPGHILGLAAVDVRYHPYARLHHTNAAFTVKSLFILDQLLPESYIWTYKWPP